MAMRQGTLAPAYAMIHSHLSQSDFSPFAFLHCYGNEWTAKPEDGSAMTNIDFSADKEVLRATTGYAKLMGKKLLSRVCHYQLDSLVRSTASHRHRACMLQFGRESLVTTSRSPLSDPRLSHWRRGGGGGVTVGVPP